jgi:hypothetical protein
MKKLQLDWARAQAVGNSESFRKDIHETYILWGPKYAGFPELTTCYTYKNTQSSQLIGYYSHKWGGEDANYSGKGFPFVRGARLLNLFARLTCEFGIPADQVIKVFSKIDYFDRCCFFDSYSGVLGMTLSEGWGWLGKEEKEPLVLTPKTNQKMLDEIEDLDYDPDLDDI